MNADFRKSLKSKPGGDLPGQEAGKFVTEAEAAISHDGNLREARDSHSEPDDLSRDIEAGPSLSKRACTDFDSPSPWLWVPATFTAIGATIFAVALVFGHTNSTEGSEPRLGFQTSRRDTDSRSAFDIIWPCLATIGACVFVAFHANIPKRFVSLDEMPDDMLSHSVKMLKIVVDGIAELESFEGSFTKDSGLLSRPKLSGVNQDFLKGKEKISEAIQKMENEGDEMWRPVAGEFREVMNEIDQRWMQSWTKIYDSLPAETEDEKKETELTNTTSGRGMTPLKILCGWAKSKWDNNKRTVKAVLIGFVAPEFNFGRALKEYINAKRGKQRMNQRGYQGWTMVHGFFAEMGGFEAASTTVIDGMKYEPGEPLISGDDSDSIAYEIVIRYLDANGITPDQLDCDLLLDQINKRGRADGLAKAVAFSQSVWTLVQSLARIVQHLSVCELEVATCAYVVCSLLTYIIWWKKPYNAQARIPLTEPRRKMNTITSSVVNANTEVFRNEGDDALIEAVLAAAVVGIIFGAIHCAAWSSSFINSNGRLLWRICSIILVAGPTLSLVTPIIAITPCFNWYSDDWTGLLILFVIFPLYCIARVILVFLIVLSFWSLPQSTYIAVRWVNFIPHIT